MATHEGDETAATEHGGGGRHGGQGTGAGSGPGRGRHRTAPDGTARNPTAGLRYGQQSDAGGIERDRARGAPIGGSSAAGRSASSGGRARHLDPQPAAGAREGARRPRCPRGRRRHRCRTASGRTSARRGADVGRAEVAPRADRRGRPSTVTSMRFVNPSSSATRALAGALPHLRRRAASAGRGHRRAARAGRPSANASAWSWVTATTVRPRRANRARSSTTSRSRRGRSSEPSGSSSSRTRGAGASARASATRCCSPPESVATSRRLHAVEPDEREQLADPLVDAPAPRWPCIRRPKAHVVAHVEVREERVVLEHHPDAALVGRGGGGVAPRRWRRGRRRAAGAPRWPAAASTCRCRSGRARRPPHRRRRVRSTSSSAQGGAERDARVR